MELPQIGEVFAGYRIDAVLGEGGFATVFAAVDAAGLPVAIKVLKSESDGRYAPDTRARFAREAQILAQLHSRHTVRLFHHGEANSGALYMAFEQIAGRDLGALLESVGRLDADSVVYVVCQVLMSLAEAHTKGLIHRDLKPENIRVFERDGDPLAVKVLDFGIARATDSGHPSITKTGELIGTPRYMSPEQLTEKPLTAASDIYSLGIVAFELLCGRDVLHGNQWGDQLERLQSGYLFGAEEAARFDEGLLRVVRRMTARRPEDRYPSAQAVLAALESRQTAANLRPAASPGAGEEFEEVPTLRRPRNRGTRGALAVVAVGGAIAGIGAFTLIGEDEATPAGPFQTHSAADKLIRRAEPRSPSGPAAPSTFATADATRDASDAAEWAALVDPVASKGCRTPAGEGPHVTRTGVHRYVPSAYDAVHPHPTLIILHSDFEPPTSLLPGSRFMELADREKLLIVMPTDPTPQHARSWRNIPDDQDVVRAAFTAASNELCVDLGRVYLVMTGDGARAGLHTICEPWVRAAAVNSWLQDRNDTVGPCPKHATPMIWLNPRNSRNLLTTTGGVGCASKTDRVSQAELEELWGTRNGCGKESRPFSRTDHGECRTWECAVPFEVCVNDGGEGWPGADSPGAGSFRLLCQEPNPPDFRAEERIWAFFSALPPSKPAR